MQSCDDDDDEGTDEKTELFGKTNVWRESLGFGLTDHDVIRKNNRFFNELPRSFRVQLG